MTVVRMAEAVGVSTDDLRLLVLNNDLRAKGERVRIRRQTFARILSAAATAIFAVQWSLLTALAVLANGALPRKIFAIVVITAVHAVLYRGWSLYAARPLAAVDRSGGVLDELGRDLSPGHVHHLDRDERSR